MFRCFVTPVVGVVDYDHEVSVIHCFTLNVAGRGSSCLGVSNINVVFVAFSPLGS